MSLLGTAEVDGRPVPLLREKVTLVLTGKLLGGSSSCHGAATAVMADGQPWVHCPEETARRFMEAVGEEAFAQIEASMHGSWGWVYRLSDLPNRHGHCNSNPNPLLARRFRGFGIAPLSGGGGCGAGGYADAAGIAGDGGSGSVAGGLAAAAAAVPGEMNGAIPLELLIHRPEIQFDH